MVVAKTCTIKQFGEHTPKLHPSVYIADGVRLIGDLEVGANSNIWFNSVIRADVHFIRIGSGTNIQDNCTIHVAAGKYSAIIGNQVTVGHGALIHACMIEDLSLIGMGAIVLDGSVIASKCLVAAGALVPPGRTFPPESLIVGNPGTVKRKLTVDEIKELERSASHYIALSASYR